MAEVDFDTTLANFTPRQMEAVRLLDSGEVKFLLYGGALGGGKSYFLRWWSIRRLVQLYQEWHISNPVGMLACEDYPSLKDRQLAKIGRELPQWLGRVHQDHKEYGRCLILHPMWGNGVLCFRNLDDPSKYASAEFAFSCVDELTKNEYSVFDHLRTRLRTHGLPDTECQFVAGTNPGSIGHGWVKLLWMDKQFPVEWTTPIDYRSQFAYVPSLADDNPHLDPSYWAMLETLPPNLREAFRYGNWDVFVGQAFPDLSPRTHTVDPIDIPPGAEIYLTHDWGFGRPFSFGWWWVDGDNRIYRFGEWYGWSGQANEGLRMTDEQIALELINREKAILPSWVVPDRVNRICGHDCFAKRPDYKGGGQGPSTAEVYSRVGQQMNYPLNFRVGDPTRHLKIRQFRERIRMPKDGGMPMLVCYRGRCDQFFRTVSSLIQDEHNIEDVDTKGEDHAYDEACLMAMARPLSLQPQKPKLSSYDKRIEWLTKGTKVDAWESYATIEQNQELKRLYAQEGLDYDLLVNPEDVAEYDDGDLVRTA